MGNAEDCTADFLWFAGTGTFPFQTNEDRLRLWWVELQDDPTLVGHTRLHGQLAVERRELAVGRVHVQPLFLGGIANANIGLLLA